MAYTRVLMVFRGFDCHGAGIRCDFCIGLGRRAYTKNKPKNKATMFAASILITGRRAHSIQVEVSDVVSCISHTKANRNRLKH